MENEINFTPLYSGGSLYIPGQTMPIVLDISGFTPPTKVPCWVEHDPTMCCGELNKIEIGGQDGKQCVNAYGQFARDPPEQAYWAREIKLKKNQGVKWESSIHTQPPCALDVEIIPEGIATEINGRAFIGPLKVFRKWKLKEGSFVFIGGDPYNAVEIAASGRANHHLIEIEKEFKMDPKLVAYIKAVWPEVEPADLTPEQAGIFERCYKAIQAAENTEASCNAKDDPAAASGDQAEPEKTDESATEGDKSDKTEPEKTDESATEGDKSDKSDPEKKEEPAAASGGFAQRNPAKTLKPGRVASTGVSGSPNINDVLTVAMMEGLGNSGEAIAASGSFKNKQNAINEGLSSKYRGMDMRNMFRLALEQRKGTRFYGAPPAGFARACLDLMDEDEIKASGNFSTVKPLTILENVFNMKFREGYDQFEGVAEKLSDIVPLDNMEEAKIVNYEISGSLSPVADDGEIPNLTLDSDSISTQVNQVAGIITLTEVMIINNRFDQFAKIVAKLGMKAKRAKETLWFKTFTNSLNSLCTSAHGNTLSNALGVSGLDVATDKLAGMTTLGSTADAPEFTEYNGKFLLVPRSLKSTADELVTDLTSTMTVEGGSNFVMSRKYKDAFEVVASNYFGSRYNSGSDTRWAILEDPAVCPVMIMSTLKGETGPRIERFPTQPKVLGRTWRCVERYGINAGDYRGVVLSTGTGN